MNPCTFCGAKITPNQERTSIALFTKPVCSKMECEKKARTEANKETEKLITPRDRVLALLARYGFEEQSIKGFFILDNGSTKVAVDLNKISGKYPGTLIPQVGVLQVNGDIIEEGHGIIRIDDLRQEIEGILKSKGVDNSKKETTMFVEEKHEEEHKKTETGKDKKVEERQTRPEKPEAVKKEEAPQQSEKTEVVIPGNVLAIMEKYGWMINDNAATKTIDGKDVLIDLSKLDLRGKSVEVAGYPYQFGQNNIVDADLKFVFGGLAKLKTPGIPVEIPHTSSPQNVSDAHENALAKIRDVELTPEAIIKYLCPDATFEEAVLFLQVCKHRNLNPFIPGEVFLIKYDKTQPAATVVGKYAFTKKADAHPDFRGYHAGIIVLNTEGKIEEREGTFYLPKGKNAREGDVFETLLGGWARVKRANREDIVSKVALHECIRYKKDGQPTRAWQEQPATQISKTAIVRALRDAFPAELGGIYADGEFEEVN